MKENDLFKYKSGEERSYFKINRAYKKKITIFYPNLFFYPNPENKEFYYVHIDLGELKLKQLGETLIKLLLKNHYSASQLGYFYDLEGLGYYNFWTLTEGKDMLVGRGVNNLLKTMKDYKGDLGIVFKHLPGHITFFGAKVDKNNLQDSYLDVHIFNDALPYADTLNHFRNIDWDIKIEMEEGLTDFKLSTPWKTLLYNFKPKPEASLYYKPHEFGQDIVDFLVIKKPKIETPIPPKFDFSHLLVSHSGGFPYGDEKGHKVKRMSNFKMLELPNVNILESEVGFPIRKSTSKSKSGFKRLSTLI